MNKIISMSVFGNNPRYIVGGKRQYELAKKYYPDWKVRIYTDNIDNFKDLDNIDLIEITDSSFGMFWRFLPMFEDKDNIVMVRDSDSRITPREVQCIEEWLDSGKSFHTFKDHDAHYNFPIIGCSFAYKGTFSKDLLNFMTKYMNENKSYGNDENFLRDYIYPLIKDDILIHSMREGWFGETRKKLKNKYSFCGNGYYENDMPIYPESFTDFSFNKDDINNKFDGGLLNE